VIEAKVKRVVIGMEDPNPLVRGRGLVSLKRAGLDVEVGILEKEFSKSLLRSMVKWRRERAIPNGFLERLQDNSSTG
jgi:diaminohydroxyphosphoribosylaminopyrimidine deaminase/5-amino-6-(5-phosphoribosylamino)uracil reductase